jgi:3-deoxy-7-phosphoheptulonate synthase
MSNRHIVMSDTNIKSITPMPTPGELKREIPLRPELFEQVVGPARKSIQDIFTGVDKRLLVIVGPCSIHNPEETLEYARRLAKLSKRVKKHILIVMRTCLDKPRTGRGWAGYFQDPEMNMSRNMEDGWRKGRRLLTEIINLGLPVAMELLDADVCQNVDELVSYWWIGARSVTSQRLREIASGLSTPVGFKNPVDGRISDAVEALDTASHETAFVATNEKGHRSEYRTNGNKFGNLILRGSVNGPNYGSEYVEDAVGKLTERGLPTRLLIDASHGNSGKDYRKQREIIQSIIKRVVSGENHVAGFLYESYLEAGSQKMPKDLSDLKPNLSITDGCDDWETTSKVLLQAYHVLAKKK